jgi:hypothetical protein
MSRAGFSLNLKRAPDEKAAQRTSFALPDDRRAEPAIITLKEHQTAAAHEIRPLSSGFSL